MSGLIIERCAADEFRQKVIALREIELRRLLRSHDSDDGFSLEINYPHTTTISYLFFFLKKL